MYSQFGNTEEFSAELIIDGVDLGTFNVRLMHNPYELNSMEAELFEMPDLDIPSLPDSPAFSDYDELDAKLITESKGFKRTITLRSDRLPGLSFPFSLSNKIPVTKYRTEQIYDSCVDTTCVRVVYRFPLTTAVRDRSMVTQDARYGLYHGTRKPSERTVDLDKDTFEIDTGLGPAEFVASYGIHDLESKHTYPGRALIQHSACVFESGGESTDPQSFVSGARNEVEKLLNVMSFTEQNRIHWNEERVYEKSKEGKILREIKTRRWAPTPSEKYRPERSGRRNARKSFLECWSAYRGLDSRSQLNIDQAIENFKRAHCAGVLETQLVFWVSCFDHMLKNLYNCSGGSFSKRIVKTFDDNDVDFEDLLDPRVARHFRQDIDDEHNCFWFVDARNRLIHEGLDALQDTPYELINAIRNAKALAERLLLDALGIDHNQLFSVNRMRLGAPSTV